jgi:hypothetical protein
MSIIITVGASGVCAFTLYCYTELPLGGFRIKINTLKKIGNVEMLLFLPNLIRTKNLLMKYLKYLPLSFSFWLPIFLNCPLTEHYSAGPFKYCATWVRRRY